MRFSISLAILACTASGCAEQEDLQALAGQVQENTAGDAEAISEASLLPVTLSVGEIESGRRDVSASFTSDPALETTAQSLEIGPPSEPSAQPEVAADDRFPWADLEGNALENFAASLQQPLRLEGYVGRVDAVDEDYETHYSGVPVATLLVMSARLQIAYQQVLGDAQPVPLLAGNTLSPPRLAALEKEKVWLHQEWTRQIGATAKYRPQATNPNTWNAQYLALDLAGIVAERSRLSHFVAEEQKRTNRALFFT